MGNDRSEADRLAAMERKEDRARFLAEFFESHRNRLRMLVKLRLDPRLQPRIDPSDVLQDAYVEALGRLDEYVEERPMPLFFWVRCITGQKLNDLHVRHLKTQKRSVGRERAIGTVSIPDATSESMAIQLSDHGPSPSEAALRSERHQRLREALDSLDPVDREALALRFLEGLSSVEVAHVLGIQDAAARARCFRALRRLRRVLPERLFEEWA